MHFRDWDHPITPTTPLPALPTEEERKKKKAQKRVRTIIDSDEEFEFDEEDTSDVPPSPRVTPVVSVPTTAILTEATSTSVPSSAGPSIPTPPPRSSPRGRSSRSDVASILPILGIEPTRRISVQTLLPLLQDTFLGFLNHMIRIQNQSVESFHRAVGLQPPQLFPTYSHPYHSTPTSPPCAQATETPAAPTPAPFVTPEELVASISRALDPTASEPSFPSVVELVRDMATSSGSHPVVEDATVGRVTPLTTSAKPVQVDSSSDEETVETTAADTTAPVVVSASEPTTLVEPVPASVESQSTVVETPTAAVELAPPSVDPAPTTEPASSSPANETSPDSSHA